METVNSELPVIRSLDIQSENLHITMPSTWVMLDRSSVTIPWVNFADPISVGHFDRVPIGGHSQNQIWVKGISCQGGF